MGRPLLVLVCALALGGCAVGGVFSAEPETMFQLAPSDVPAKVVTVELDCERGRLVVDQPTIARIERMPGVYAVRRGAGRNVVHVLVDDFVRPESIAERLEPECYGRVAGVAYPPKD